LGRGRVLLRLHVDRLPNREKSTKNVVLRQAQEPLNFKIPQTANWVINYGSPVIPAMTIVQVIYYPFVVYENKDGSRCIIQLG
jgi:hypothetical protein